ncbi:MAG: YbhN family protein, partial [Halobacteriaceae archaeon]
VTLISSIGVLVFGYSVQVFAALLGTIGLGLLVVQHEPTCVWVLDLTAYVPGVNRYTEQLRSLYFNSQELLDSKPLVVTTLLSVISWGLECIGMWLVLEGFGVNASILLAAFVFAFASILGALSLLPGGIGITEGTMTGLLLFVGINRTAAVSTTLVIRAATLWFVAIGAILVYLHFRSQQMESIHRLLEED